MKLMGRTYLTPFGGFLRVPLLLFNVLIVLWGKGVGSRDKTWAIHRHFRSNLSIRAELAVVYIYTKFVHGGAEAFVKRFESPPLTLPLSPTFLLLVLS